MNSHEEHLISKYKISKKYYKTKLAENDVIKYLYYFDIMNSYSIFPTIIDFPISNYISSDINILDNNIIAKYGTFKHTNSSKFINKIHKKTKAYSQLATDKEIIKENVDLYNKYAKEYIPLKKFFNYDLIDELVNNYNAENVTVAWLKCYELICHYKLLDNFNKIKCFCICEQPGAFIYAINHYTTEILNKKIKFILQSLNHNMYKHAFRPCKYMYETYKNKYDYGPNLTGDITDLDNIKYYRKKYYNYNFSLITADCGMDCSDDFSQQENNIISLIVGQFITAIGLSCKGSNYIFKLFTLYENVTQQLIFLLGLLYDNVYISRTLSTKITSGEVYCVCKYFKYTKENIDNLFNDLCVWYTQFKLKENNNANLLNNIINDQFYEHIDGINKTLLYRRLLNINFMYFRYLNYEVTFKNSKISKYINDLSNHYVDYFISFYNIQQLSNNHKLVSHIFVQKKNNIQKRSIVDFTSTIYKINNIELDFVFYNDTYMFILEGSNNDLIYKHTKNKLNILYNINNDHIVNSYTDDKINEYITKNKLRINKGHTFIMSIGNKYMALYYDYSNVLLVSELYKSSYKYNKKITQIYLYDFTAIRKYNTPNSFNSEFCKKYIKNIHNVKYTYIDVSNFSINTNKINSYKLPIILCTLSHIYSYNNINIINILIGNILNILTKMSQSSSLIIIMSPMYPLIFYDIINFISQYFDSTTLHSYKYTTMYSICVIFHNKIKNIEEHSNIFKKMLKISTTTNTIIRLYSYNIDPLYIDFINKMENSFTNRYNLFMNILNLNYQNRLYYKLIYKTIENKKLMFKKLMLKYKKLQVS
jgi:hypothetical protein